jgi:hypothetical protein
MTLNNSFSNPPSAPALKERKGVRQKEEGRRERQSERRKEENLCKSSLLGSQ